jgi:hypothetical protein
MALCPFAIHELLPENSSQNRITPTTVICHRAVSSARDLYGYWNTPGVNLESHFYINEQGTIYQYMDTNVRADANVQANAFAVSIETWDGGNTPDSQGWNGIQVLRLKQLIKWICDTHGIKKEPARTWNGGGIGGHNWFPEPWADGPRGCPGTERNRQLREEIIPAVASGNIEDEVTPEEFWNHLVDVVHGDGSTHQARAVDVLRFSELQHAINRDLIKDLQVRVDALAGTLGDDEVKILAAIRAIPGGPGGGLTPEQVEAVVRAVFADAGNAVGS